MTGGLSPINRALNRIPKRAEQRQAEQLRDTFVDSGVAAALDTIDHQVLYGRRGTGKTHALRYIEGEVRARGDVAVYLDLRTIGSPDGLFAPQSVSESERTARLLVDLLGQVHDALLEAAIDDESLIEDAAFIDKLDALVAAITSVRVRGDVEIARGSERKSDDGSGARFGLTITATPGVEAQLSSTRRKESREVLRETRSGVEHIGLYFTDVARTLRELAGTLSTRRVWLLLDEWSSVPGEVQPYLGEFLVRCVLPLQMFTVKIAAIEQQTNFRLHRKGGSPIGIEVGADVSANVDLDEFMVFEQNEERSRSFFRGLLFKHLTSAVETDDPIEGLRSEQDLVRLGFTDKRAFDELVRAAEGVPRDAINIAGKSALRAGQGAISVPNVRVSARGWFQADKEGALRGSEEASRLLSWIIDEVIRGKRARGFLVNQKSAGAPLLLALFDARVLHIVRRGYSAQDEPGERYDVWVIDYGAYVDLVHTKFEPQGLLAGTAEGEYVEVPTQHLRAIRRAILDLNAFGETVTENSEL